MHMLITMAPGSNDRLGTDDEVMRPKSATQIKSVACQDSLARQVMHSASDGSAKGSRLGPIW